MKKFVMILAGLCAVISTKATTYYTVANGAWGAAIWSSVCSTCAGSTLPALVAGDILIIDDRATISSGVLTITPTVTIIIRTDVSPNTSTTPAKLIFTTGGKLDLTSASSKVILENTTGNAANNPEIDGSGSGGSNLINVGGFEYWRASDGDIKGVGTLQPDGTLPITLISFVATKLENSIQLKWLTAMEKNFSHFQLEKSNENLAFIPIARIDGKGGLDVTTSYIHLDTSPQSGKNYYRLKSVDHDLSFEYSPVVVVDFKSDNNIVVYPNPAVDGSINVRTNFSPQEGDRIEIYDNLGLKLFGFDVVDYDNLLQFKGALKQGSYLLRYVSHAHTEVVRFSAK